MNQSFIDVTLATEKAQNTFVFFDAQTDSLISTLIGLLVIEYLFVFTWPVLLVFLCLFNYINFCVLDYGYKKRNKKPRTKQQLNINAPVQTNTLIKTDNVGLEGQQDTTNIIEQSDPIVLNDFSENDKSQNMVPDSEQNLVHIELEELPLPEEEHEDVQQSKAEDGISKSNIKTDQENPTQQAEEIGQVEVVHEPRAEMSAIEKEEISSPTSMVETMSPVLSISIVDSSPTSPVLEGAKRDNKVTKIIDKFEKVKEEKIQDSLERSRKSYRSSKRFDFEKMLREDLEDSSNIDRNGSSSSENLVSKRKSQRFEEVASMFNNSKSQENLVAHDSNTEKRSIIEILKKNRGQMSPTETDPNFNTSLKTTTDVVKQQESKDAN